MRIQFEINEEMWKRMQRYVSSQKVRHETARDALEEWITRHEGRDKKYRQERMLADAEIFAPVIQHLIDSKLVVIKQ